MCESRHLDLTQRKFLDIKIDSLPFTHMHTDAHPSTLSSFPANGDKVAQKIYQQLSGVNPCVLLTNATHQIGCTCKLLS